MSLIDKIDVIRITTEVTQVGSHGSESRVVHQVEVQGLDVTVRQGQVLCNPYCA